jgi:cytoskeletal protein RodZ
METSAEVVTEKKLRRFRLGWLNIFLIILLLVAFGVAGYFYYQYKYNSPEAVKAREVRSVTDTIGSVLMLPEENPTIATVTDKEKLSGQAFFQKAENGDKVIIYRQSGKAILYRPGIKKIVDVVTLNQATEAQAEEVKPAAEEKQEALQVALYNGGTKVGVTDVAEKQIVAGLPGVQVTAKEKAAKSDYVGTVVVDVSGKNGDKASALASLLGAQVGSLPSGEVTPQADIAVIIGNTEALAPTPAPEEKKKN